MNIHITYDITIFLLNIDIYIVLVAFTSFEYRPDVLHLEIIDACMAYTLYFFMVLKKCI